MKKNNQLLILVLFLSIAISAAAGFSGKYLSVKKSGSVFKYRLYSSTADFSSQYSSYTALKLAARVNGSTLYVGSGKESILGSRIASSPLKFYFSSEKYSARPIAFQIQKIGETRNSFDARSFDVDSNERFYILNEAADQVYVYSNVPGQYATQVATWTLPYNASGIVIDSVNNVYIGNLSAINIAKYNTSGTLITTYSGLSSLSRSVFANGHIYARKDYSGSGYNYTIGKYTTSFSLVSTSGSVPARFFSVNGADNLFTTEGSEEYKYGWNGTLLAANPRSFNSIYSVAYLPDADFFIVCENGQSGFNVVFDQNMGGVGIMEDDGGYGFGGPNCGGMVTKNGKIYALKNPGTKPILYIISY